jgi:ATP-binding protein involved in chromosome partitioning
MPTTEEVRQALRSVLDPEIGRPIEDVGMLKEIEIDGGEVRVHVLLTIAGCPMRERIDADVTGAVAPLPGVERVRVLLGEMNEQERQSLVGKLRGGAPQQEQQFFTDGKTAVIAVASGKGGVGKSSVTVNLACALAAEGHRVGVVDVDVWGFSVPRMLGVIGQRPTGYDGMIYPLQSHGVKVISMGFFVEEERPVIWRGPMLHKAVQQFLGDVYWGDLDFLLADLPPGTGDVSLSMAQFLPGAQMLVVTTPQDAARKVAERAGRMAEQVRQRVVGVIENMSYFVCPHCGEATEVFGAGGGAEAAETLDVPLLGRIPLTADLRAGGDSGTPIVVSNPDSPAGEALRSAARELAMLAKTNVRRPLQLTVAPGAGGPGGTDGHSHDGHAHAHGGHTHGGPENGA